MLSTEVVTWSRWVALGRGARKYKSDFVEVGFVIGGRGTVTACTR